MSCLISYLDQLVVIVVIVPSSTIAEQAALLSEFEI